MEMQVQGAEAVGCWTLDLRALSMVEVVCFAKGGKLQCLVVIIGMLYGRGRI